MWFPTINPKVVLSFAVLVCVGWFWPLTTDAGAKHDPITGQLLPGESSQASGPECETWKLLVNPPPMFNISDCPSDDEILPGPLSLEHPGYLQPMTQARIHDGCINFLPPNADLTPEQNKIFENGLCANLAHTMVTTWTWHELKLFITAKMSAELETRLWTSMKTEGDACLAQMADPQGHGYDGKSLPGFCGHIRYQFLPH